MALSGSFTGTANNRYILPTITWSASQSIDGNYSVVTATLAYSRTNSGYTTSGTWSGSLAIDGDTKSAAQRLSITQGSNTAAITHTVRVPHNADGTKSVTISAAGGIPGTSFTSTSISATVELDAIPRASTPTLDASAAEFGGRITVYTNRASSSFTHHLYYSLNGGAEVGIAPDITERYTWTIPAELMEQIPNAASATLRFRLYTFSGGVNIGNRTVSLPVSVPRDAAPTISAVTLREAAAGLAEQFGAYVQNKSALRVDTGAEGVYGSTIQSCLVSVDGKSYTGSSVTTQTLSSSGTLALKATVTDSRGRSASRTVSVEVLPYENPAITAFTAYRCSKDGSAAADGDYVSLTYAYRISPVGGKNTAAMEVACKRFSAAESAYTALLTGTEYARSDTVVPAAAISADYQWQLRLTVADWFTSTQMAVTLPSAEVILDLLSDGKGVAFGKTAETPVLLDTAWDARFRGDLSVDGSLEVAQALRLGGSGLADFIVAQSIDSSGGGSWSWVKYASGLAMCWGRRNVSGNFDNLAWGALYTGGEMGSIAYPFPFAAVPFCTAARTTADTADYNDAFTLLSSTGGTAAQTPRFELVRGTEKTIGHPYIVYFAVGRWK